MVNHIEANRGKFNEGKHLEFPIVSHPRGPYNHHIMVRVDTGADVNCMNENTFNKLFPELQLSVCPHEIENFRNSVADISIPGQFCTYLEFRGEKYLNTFIVTDANDCLNLLSHGATFRMGILLSKHMVIDGDNVPHFNKMSGDKMRAPNGTWNVFQILGVRSLVELGILEEVKEHTDLVNSYVIVEKDSGNHHAPNHTIKRKLRICLDPRDLNGALERGTLPYTFCG